MLRSPKKSGAYCTRQKSQVALFEEILTTAALLQACCTVTAALGCRFVLVPCRRKKGHTNKVEKTLGRCMQHN